MKYAAPEIQTATQGSSDLDVWHEIAGSINSGAYAVLLTLFLIYVVSRHAVGKALEHHFSMMNSLRDAAARNSKSLKRIADTHEVITNYYIGKAGAPDPEMMLRLLKEYERGEQPDE